jgi:hypothetical protein
MAACRGKAQGGGIVGTVATTSNTASVREARPGGIDLVVAVHQAAVINRLLCDAHVHSLDIQASLRYDQSTFILAGTI